MNNKLKKAISMFTATAAITAALSLPATTYADDSYEDSIYMSGFSDYDSDGTPNGWIKAKYITQTVNGTEQEVENTGSYAHTNNDNGNNALYIDSSAGSLVKDVIPFGKVVSSGKLHISFDHKIPVASYNGKQSSMIMVLFNMNNPQKYRETNVPFNNYDPDNLDDFRGTVGHQQSHLIRVPYYNTKDQYGKDVDKNDQSLNIKVSNIGSLYWTPAAITDGKIDCNKWYHFDVVVDLDNNVYDVWLDGEKITNSVQGTLKNNSGYNRFKGLAFLQQDGNLKKGLYDNVFVTNYSDEDFVKIVSDVLYNDEAFVYTDVAFSEYLDRVPENGDFAITDSYTGDAVDYEVDSGDRRHATLKINTDKAAKLSIAFNPDSTLGGTISSRLSDKKASVFTNVKQNGTIVPVLNEVSAVDYNGNNVKLDGSEVVPIGTTTANVSFSTPVSLDGIYDKVYIQNADSGEKLDVNYTVADDNKSVKMDFAELMSADSDYKLVISDTVSSYENDSVLLPHSYEYSFRTSNDGGFGIFGDKITVDEAAGTATFAANIIKSDENAYKGTIIICGYSDEEADGRVYTKLDRVDIQKYDIETNSITSYETKPIDINGLNRIRCFITDAKTNRIILIAEKEF